MGKDGSQFQKNSWQGGDSTFGKKIGQGGTLSGELKKTGHKQSGKKQENCHLGLGQWIEDLGEKKIT